MWFALEPCAPDYGAHAPAHFENSVQLDASAEEVFDLLLSTEHFPEFFPDMRRMEWLTGGPPRAGSRRRAILALQSVEEHFTVVERPTRLAFYLERSTLPLTSHFMEDYVLEPIPGEGDSPSSTCQLVWRVHYRPLPVMRILHPILRPLFARMFRQARENLASYVSSGDFRRRRAA